MVEETDGLEEAIERELRAIGTAAGKASERLVRARENALLRGQTRSAPETRDLHQENAEAERRRAASEKVEAQQFLAEANQEDQQSQEMREAAAHEPDPDERARASAEAEQREAAGDHARQDSRMAYDSAERREGTARELEARGIDGQTVSTRMRADVSQARPATAAVRQGSAGRSPQVRQFRGRAVQLQAHRPGVRGSGVGR
ncbi:MAG: hypothetical protein Q4G21_09695 [Dermabacter sp.]|nr:hypothetical protein [Dermabacter sp.]